MNNTVALLSSVPTLLLLYVIIYFTQTLSGKRQFYGVSLNSDYFSMKEFKDLDKKFKLWVTIGFVIFTVFTLILIYLFEAYTLSMVVPILGFCLYQFAVFIIIHNRVKELKKSLSLDIDNLELEKTQLTLDTNFINEKNKIIKKYSILFSIPIVIAVILSIYAFTQYDNMPDMIPTHWGFNGVADAFSKKSLLSLSFIVGINIGVGLLLYVSAIYSLKSRCKVNVAYENSSPDAHLYYLNKFALTFLVLIFACQILLISTLIATINASNINPYLLYICLIATILAAIYQCYLYYKSPSKSKKASYTVEDDDSYWIFGTLYNNPQDPSFFVQKRFGVGWTVNIGTTKGKLFILILIMIVISSIAVAYYM